MRIWAGAPARPGSTTAPRQAYVALGAGLTLVLVCAATADRAAAPYLYVLTAGYGTVLSVAGARRMPRARRRIWWAFAVAQAAFLLGDVCWLLLHHTADRMPYPSVADVGYLASYPCLALGLLWMIRGRRRGRDSAAFLDALIMAVALTVVGVVFLVAPAAGGGAGLLAKAVTVAYPAADLVVLGLAVRMVTGGTARNGALLALLGGTAFMLAADLFYVEGVVTGVPHATWVDAAYLMSFVLFGVAAVHPAAHALSEPLPDPVPRVGLPRLVLLGVALVLAPVTGQVAHLTGFGSGSWVALVGGFAVAGLVVARLTGLVRDLQVKAVQLAALARRDALTGVANRRTWDHELSRALAIARDQAQPVAVAILDLDHLSTYNDEHGHLAGDRVLKATAAAWSCALPEDGFLARRGGAEFAVLLPRIAVTDAARVLERLRGAVSHEQTCSAGVAAWDGVESPAELVARADRTLYEAKRRGRDRLAVHDGRVVAAEREPQPQDPVLATIRTAYQPIVDVQTGEVVAFEALSRFDGATPLEVFERAAREGTAAAVEALAIRTALASWDGEHHLALNVSLTALVTDVVLDALPEDLFGIILEITEADLVDYTDDLLLTLDRLRARRALVAIDDFGVGFSNVHRILTIRPDLIKLDMSLIRDIDRDEMRQAVITACLVFARQTGSRVVAEGIETPAEMECLVRHGVELGQGYLIGHPTTPG